MSRAPATTRSPDGLVHPTPKHSPEASSPSMLGEVGPVLLLPTMERRVESTDEKHVDRRKPKTLEAVLVRAERALTAVIENGPRSQEAATMVALSPTADWPERV